jgi:hypothetical protein
MLLRPPSADLTHGSRLCARLRTRDLDVAANGQSPNPLPECIQARVIMISPECRPMSGASILVSATLHQGPRRLRRRAEPDVIEV